MHTKSRLFADQAPNCMAGHAKPLRPLFPNAKLVDLDDGVQRGKTEKQEKQYVHGFVPSQMKLAGDLRGREGSVQRLLFRGSRAAYNLESNPIGGGDPG